MGTIASDMTIAHLGDEATEADLEEFRGYVDALMTRDGISEEEATDAVFGEGDWLANVVRLGLAQPAAQGPQEGSETMGTITKGATTMGTLLEAIETAGRHVGKVLDRDNMTSWERDFVLSRAAEALAHAYFKATGKPLKW